MQRDKGLLLDMKRAAMLILQFAEQMSFDKFRSDLKTQSAIIHQFLVIGEVAKLLSEDFRKSNPEIPWSAMARMRDKLIHHYRGVDLREIWNAAELEISKLLSFLNKHLPEQ
ncbi:MAG: hypothetical protein CEE38_17495 [Planctomycetes bacterium B3_Pla]|nr:MAG: hypothetical protein CEE38_17495 [Planctomycetes bacterium B3_Pla]